MTNRLTAMLAVGLLSACAPGGSVNSSSATPSADRLYALDCGTLSVADKSLWTPGKDVGSPYTFAEHCYLIRHGSDYVLWDTGIADALTGRSFSARGMTVTRTKSLAAQLTELGVDPAAIKFVALSHAHADHTGNVAQFPNATLLMQKSELASARATGAFTPPAGMRIQELEGDLDLYGDGSVQVLATPGHTVGHQSLLVRLRRTGSVILSGDLAHLMENYVGEIIPSLNADAGASVSSIRKVKEIAARLRASVWINHDPDQGRTINAAPAFYE